MTLIWRVGIGLVGGLAAAACSAPAEPAGAAAWEQLTAAAAFPESYNFPVHVAADGRFVALHSAGTWTSRDGATWEQSGLPPRDTNTAYLQVLQHEGATWALGRHSGDYQGFTIDPVIRRTKDHERWEEVGRSATLPPVIFYGATSFAGSIWIVGGYCAGQEVAAVWRSANGLDWTRVVATAPWSARANPEVLVFRHRLWLIGGGVIDGPNANDVWSSDDGVAWRREAEAIAPEPPVGFTAVVFDDRIWLLGANRSGGFTSELLTSDDGRRFRAGRAPWSPRGGVAAWSHGTSLYVTGGKFSVEHDGEHVFTYSNDVWRMRSR
ncbi:MAG: hypothetical protein JNL08_02410 [Planctomycetes bacterium]|nr:hypothetical protein [Planctomycetota bacterium]